MTAVWTAPRTWVDTEVPTKAIMDAHLRDDEEYLKAGVDAFAPRTQVLDKQVNVSGVSNGAGAFASLLAYLVPENTLFENLMAIRVTATGRLALNSNPKQLALYWGPLSGPSAAQPLDTGVNITTGGNFRLRAWVTRYGLQQTYAFARCTVGVAAPAADIQVVDRSFGTEDETADILLTLAGYSAAAGQVTGHTFLVELLHAPA